MNPSDQRTWDLKDSGHRRTAVTGAQRDRAVGKGRYDLASPFPAARKAQINEKGATKYEDRNWERGMPLSWFLDSAERHIAKAKMGMTDEDHWAQAAWNLDALMHTQEMIARGVLPKELDDLPNYIGIAVAAARIPMTANRSVGAAVRDIFAKELVGPLFAAGLKEAGRQLGATCRATKHNIYVAGPFTARTDVQRGTNIQRAADIGLRLMRKGHRAHVPHAATARWHGMLDREPIMDLDFSIIDTWASALFYIGPSPGADAELGLADGLGLVIFRSLEEVPSLTNLDGRSPNNV